MVIPGEPLPGIFEELGGVFLKRNQVMERVDPVEGDQRQLEFPSDDN